MNLGPWKPKLTDLRLGYILVRLGKNVRIDSFDITSSQGQDLPLKTSSITYFLIIQIIHVYYKIQKSMKKKSIPLLTDNLC